MFMLIRPFSATLYANLVVSMCLTYSRCILDKRGNRVLIAICVMNMFLYLFVYCFYKGINKRRDKIWNSWSAKVRSLLLFIPLTRHDASII